MANRFLDTNFFKSPFVRGLEGSLKLLYSYIICDCDGAGIWNLDLEIARVYIGFGVTEEDFIKHFVQKEKAISLGGGKYFFPDFIEHQYPSGLQANNKAHRNFINTLKKYDLIDDDLQLKSKPLQSPLKGGLCNGNGNGQGNGSSLEGSGDFSSIELNSKTLEAAEMNQYDMTKNKNTEFVKSQWNIFLLERSNDPPTKQKDYLNHHSKLYSHFLNWLRPKKPPINGTHKSPVNGDSQQSAGYKSTHRTNAIANIGLAHRSGDNKGQASV